MKTIVISLGGSIIVPKEIDIVFLKRFKALIEKYLIKDYRFIIVAGGGYTCRQYQQAAAKVTKMHQEDLDWLGIHATRLNAHLLRTIFREYANPFVIKDPTSTDIAFSEKILVAAGWKPGWSTDYDTVILTQKSNADTIINLTDNDYVYNKDPRKFRDAKPRKEISWKEFRKIVGDKWVPGMNVPFDPVASKAAEESGIKVVMLNGRNTKNLGNFLDGKKFIATIIS